jgi:hypothetical protein
MFYVLRKGKSRYAQSLISTFGARIEKTEYKLYLPIRATKSSLFSVSTVTAIANKLASSQELFDAFGLTIPCEVPGSNGSKRKHNAAN